MSVTLPTPPSSPISPTTRQESDPLEQLKTLQQYYANAGAWVHQTRAALFELALARGAESEQQQEQHLPASPSASDVTSGGESDTADLSAASKAEARAAARASLLVRRKHGMKLELKLDGIGARRRYRRPAPHVKPASSAPAALALDGSTGPAQPAVVLPGDHIAHMLQLFGDLVDSRMESCQRMERLVRGAQTADLAWRT